MGASTLVDGGWVYVCASGAEREVGRLLLEGREVVLPLGEYDVTVVIETFDEDREIAWSIDGAIQPPIGHVYGYRLEPVDGGTLVTSYYDWSNLHENYREMARDVFPIISETNLRATLGILARTVAPGRPRPGAGDD